jgi:hypothetical protein
MEERRRLEIVTVIDRGSVVLAEPLNGGTPERRVTRASELQNNYVEILQ